MPPAPGVFRLPAPASGLGAAVLAILTALTAPAGAQQIPGTVEPGRPIPPEAPLPRAPVELDWTVVLPGGAEVPARMAEEVIRFEDLVIEGVTVYAPGAFEDLYAEYRGGEITFGQLYGIARAIQARYQGDGYLLSFAYIPPQRVKDGVYRIVVVEGFVERIVVEGLENRLRRTVAGRLAAIAEERPLTVATLERHMLLANDLPGVTATGVLQPAEDQPGAADLIVKAAHAPLDANILGDNRGSAFEGPWRAHAAAGANSLAGLGERVTLSASITPLQPEELKAVDFVYMQPLGDDGITVTATADYSRSEPGFTLRPFEVETTGVNVGLEASYPVVRTRSRNVTISGGVSLRNTEVDLLDGAFSEDRIRTLHAGLSYGQSGFLGGATGLRADVVQGLPVLNYTDPDDDDMSRADAEPTFTKVTASLARAQPLFSRLTFVATVTGQYSFDPLPASEEFAAGGPRFGRGYDLAEVTGEHGIAAAFELTYDLRPGVPLVRLVRPYVFYDIGKAWDEETSSSTGPAESLASAGLGVEVELEPGVGIGLEYARPLTRASLSDTDRDGRLFLTLNARF